MRKEIINRQMEAKNLREDLEAASRQYTTDKKEFEELEDKLDRLKVLGRVPSSCLSTFSLFSHLSSLACLLGHWLLLSFGHLFVWPFHSVSQVSILLFETIS